MAEHGQVLNYNGDRVEQSSSLLHSLLLALLAAASPAHLPLFGSLFAMAMGLATLCLAQRLAARIEDRAALYAPWLVALTPCVLFWSFGKLETSLVMALYLVWILAHGSAFAADARFKRTLCLCCVDLLVIAVRPEAVMVITAALLCAGLWLAVVNKTGERRESFVPWVLSALALALASTLFFTVHYLYFGLLFPQPVYAKIKLAGFMGMLHNMRQGVGYLATYPVNVLLLLLALLFALYAVAQAVRGRKQASIHAGLGISLLLGQVSFILFSGGDWMLGARFFAPAAPIAAVLISAGLSSASRAGMRRASAAVLVLALVVSGVQILREHSLAMPAWRCSNDPFLFDSRDYSWFEKNNRVHRRDIVTAEVMKLLVRKLRQSGLDRVNIWTGQMGFVAYHLTRENEGHLRFVDRFGLTDRYLTRCSCVEQVPRVLLGMDMRYGVYARLAHCIHKTCGVPEPDIIYDLCYQSFVLPQELEAVAALGYTPVFFQDGSVDSGSTLLPGRPLPADAFILIRNKLLPKLGWNTPHPGAF